MVVRNRAGVLAFGSVFVVVLGLGTLPMAAQQAARPAQAPGSGAAPEKKAYDPARRVPDFFGQIGLTPDQREEIYKIRAKHQQKVDELQKQLTRVRSEMVGECESVLNDTQRKLL